MPIAPLLLLLTLAALALPVCAQIVMIAHPDNPLRQFNVQQITNLYLGRIVRIDRNGERTLVLDHPRDSKLRKRFYRKLTGMDPSRINAYWARLQFSGGTTPPLVLPDSQAVIALIRSNRQAIGYVDTAHLTDGVRPILTIE